MCHLWRGIRTRTDTGTFQNAESPRTATPAPLPIKTLRLFHFWVPRTSQARLTGAQRVQEARQCRACEECSAGRINACVWWRTILNRLDCVILVEPQMGGLIMHNAAVRFSRLDIFPYSTPYGVRSTTTSSGTSTPYSSLVRTHSSPGRIARVRVEEPARGVGDMFHPPSGTRTDHLVFGRRQHRQ